MLNKGEVWFLLISFFWSRNDIWLKAKISEYVTYSVLSLSLGVTWCVSRRLIWHDKDGSDAIRRFNKSTLAILSRTFCRLIRSTLSPNRHQIKMTKPSTKRSVTKQDQIYRQFRYDVNSSQNFQFAKSTSRPRGWVA